MIYRTMLITMLLAIARSVAGDWNSLAPLPNRDGVAGAYAGVSGGALLVCGGANFPGKMPWDGGTKVWHDTVYVLEKPDGTWKVADQRLPRPLGYGVSSTFGDAVICAGGGDAQRNYAEVFSLAWRDGRLVMTSLPPLPMSIANACGAMVGSTLYVAGGQERPDSTRTLHTFHAIDLAADKPAWRRVEPWPGPGRMLAVAASADGAFWLFSGVDLVVQPDGTAKRRYLRDAYHYDPTTGWKQIADLPAPAVAAPSPAVINIDSTILILGGDDGTKAGFTPPQQHPGFSKRTLAYDPKAGKWSAGAELPFAQVTTPTARWRESWIVPSGEVRPGVRSPAVWVSSP